MRKNDAIKQATQLLQDDYGIDMSKYRVETSDFAQTGDNADMPLLFICYVHKTNNVRINLNAEFFNGVIAQYHVKV